MSLKDVVENARRRVDKGQGTEEDKAILHLVSQVRQLKEKLRKEDEELPVHKQHPWYMD